MRFVLVVLLFGVSAACSSNNRSVLIPRAPSDDLSVRRFFIVFSGPRLLGEREPTPNDPAAFITVDLVEYNGIARAFWSDDPARGCPARWVPSLRASDIFPDPPNGDRAGWFRSLCEGKGQGEVYDLDGSCFGACPSGNLSELPLSIERGKVRVHLPEN